MHKVPYGRTNNEIRISKKKKKNSPAINATCAIIRIILNTVVKIRIFSGFFTRPKTHFLRDISLHSSNDKTRTFWIRLWCHADIRGFFFDFLCNFLTTGREANEYLHRISLFRSYPTVRYFYIIVIACDLVILRLFDYYSVIIRSRNE